MASCASAGDADTGVNAPLGVPRPTTRVAFPTIPGRSERRLGEEEVPALAAFVEGGIGVRPQRRAGLALVVLDELAVDELALHELAAGKGGAAEDALHEARFDEQAFLEHAPVPVQPGEGAAEKRGVDVPALEGEAGELAMAEYVLLQNLRHRFLLPILGPLE